MSGYSVPSLKFPPSHMLALIGLSLVGLHLALIVKVTGNLDQLMLSLLFWGVITTRVQQQLPLQWARSPLARVLGIATMVLLCLRSLQISDTETAFVRLFPLFMFAGWTVLVRRSPKQGEWQVWVLIVTLSIPPRALPLLLETILGLPIRVATAAIAAFGLHYLGFDVVQQGSLIQVPAGTVDVEFACTGAALLGLLWQVSVLLAAVTEWRRLGTFMGWSMAIAAFLSTVRVAIMATVVGRGGAFQFWHGSSGGQLFTLMALTSLACLSLTGAEVTNRTHTKSEY